MLKLCVIWHHYWHRFKRFLVKGAECFRVRILVEPATLHYSASTNKNAPKETLCYSTCSPPTPCDAFLHFEFLTWVSPDQSEPELGSGTDSSSLADIVGQCYQSKLAHHRLYQCICLYINKTTFSVLISLNSTLSYATFDKKLCCYSKLLSSSFPNQTFITVFLCQ